MIMENNPLFGTLTFRSGSSSVQTCAHVFVPKGAYRAFCDTFRAARLPDAVLLLHNSYRVWYTHEELRSVQASAADH